jgi:hypothetical protein
MSAATAQRGFVLATHSDALLDQLHDPAKSQRE